MKSLWNNKIAQQYVSQYKKKNIEKDLALRIYTTHLLGKNPKLVLHGGGNSSVKSLGKNLYKKNVNLIYVKGSGWDMSNLNELGMPGLELKPLLETIKLNELEIRFLKIGIHSLLVFESTKTYIEEYEFCLTISSSLS